MGKVEHINAVQAAQRVPYARPVSNLCVPDPAAFRGIYVFLNHFFDVVGELERHDSTLAFSQGLLALTMQRILTDEALKGSVALQPVII